MKQIDLINDPDFLEEVIGWDVFNWMPAINHWQSVIAERPKGRCLELGCGPGGISLFMAMSGLEVTCSDLEIPGDEVREFHAKFNFEQKIKYEAINALNIPYEDHFDYVVFKSVLGGASRGGVNENRTIVMEQIKKCLKNGGKLLFAENSASSPFHQFFRKHFVKWGDNWNYITFSELKQELEIFDLQHIKVNGFAGAFGRTEKQRNFLGRLDRMVFDMMVPNHWHYVIYGSAKA